MSINDAVQAYNYLQNRGVTRLCHFTKTKNLVHILASEDGILATEFISKEIKQQNDTERSDGMLDHVCCSLQYPNGWYWRQVRARDKDKVFKDWVVLIIRLEILKGIPFKFCCCNAAKDSGAHIKNDLSSISVLFDKLPETRGYRTPSMLSCCPTDDQAEILIYKNIPYRYIGGIIVGSQESADNITAILKTIGKDMPVYISPAVCNTDWSSQVRQGIIPLETKYPGEGEE